MRQGIHTQQHAEDSKNQCSYPTFALRQLRNDLQVMLDQRGREEVLEAQKDPAQNASETADTKQNPKQSAAKKDDSTRRLFRADTEVSEADGTVSGADEEDPETDRTNL